MKKLITLFAVFLIGTASVFAQWDVDVIWSYNPNTDCCPEDLPSGNYEIEITLSIYDAANSQQITPTNPPPTETEDVDETSTYFSEAQCQVSDYCEESHNNTPLFTVTVWVAFVNTATQEEYCYASKSVPNKTINDFYNTVDVEVTFN